MLKRRQNLIEENPFNEVLLLKIKHSIIMSIMKKNNKELLTLKRRIKVKKLINSAKRPIRRNDPFGETAFGETTFGETAFGEMAFGETARTRIYGEIVC